MSDSPLLYLSFSTVNDEANDWCYHRYQVVSEGDLINPYAEELINPYEEIQKITQLAYDVYLTEEQSTEFKHPETGILRQVQRTANIITNHINRKEFPKKDVQEYMLPKFKEAVDEYNKAIDTLTRNGTIAENLDNTRSLSLSLVKMILQQSYDRTVSPKIESLKAYENGTDGVYGELLFPFISRILKTDTEITSDQVFVDLGSGVGNVVLQAALQIGCESWGIELMPNASKLAAKQKDDFTARCQAWGVRPGAVHLEDGSFFENKNIDEVLKRADVVVVNNQVFNPETNQELLNKFLDLKEGCKIVSLQSFVPDGWELTARNSENPVNLFTVSKKSFGEGEVSWQGGGGNYYVAVKDSEKLKRFQSRGKR